ncbi:C2 domain-containing protein 5 isoform X2 [Aethina tumida]|uniref:C2 domain-containing protein 5 isoform X2 n=1 Tax=Aethina tumida TaxID=116153 RepID=UPI0021487950|nr:C2 domain-containing protein 5 isoform X2 [Aethina tumida]
MPGKVKVKIISGKNLPVMDRSSDTTDAYVEIKLGSTTYKTDVCRKSLHPQWNSEWYRFEVDDSELQDEPLQIRLMDHDTYSANDAIGKVYLNLNPLLLPAASQLNKHGFNGDTNSNHDNVGSSVMSGWIPVYDTMHGIRGEVNITVKVDLFSDFNRYRQSSCGVQFYCSPTVPQGYYAQVIHGFVEELIVDDDPEYQWIDKIRTPRASNEARQTLFFKLSGELQRKIGVKAINLGGNAVIGYNQQFDLEGECGVVARGIGTAVTLVKTVDMPCGSAVSTVVNDEKNDDRALNYLKFVGCDKSFRLNSAPAHSSLLIPFPAPAKPFHPKIYERSLVKPNYNFTRHLSYNEHLRSTQSNPSLNEHTPLKTLLKQEDKRGTPGHGISQRFKNLKYSSQSSLSKKMTALKAKLGDTGIGEETEEYLPIDATKKRSMFKKTHNANNSAMAELLARSVIHAHNSLSCILEVQNSPQHTDSESETLDKLEPLANLLSKSEPDIISDDNISEQRSYSSSDSTSSDYDCESNDLNQDINYDELDTISNILSNVELLERDNPKEKLKKQYSMPALMSRSASVDQAYSRRNVFAFPADSEDDLSLNYDAESEYSEIIPCEADIIEDVNLDTAVDADPEVADAETDEPKSVFVLEEQDDLDDEEPEAEVKEQVVMPSTSKKVTAIIPPVNLGSTIKPKGLVKTAMQTILLEKVNIIGTYTPPTSPTSRVPPESVKPRMVYSPFTNNTNNGHIKMKKSSTAASFSNYSRKNETVLGVPFTHIVNLKTELKRQQSQPCLSGSLKSSRKPPQPEDVIVKARHNCFSDSELHKHIVDAFISQSDKKRKKFFSLLLKTRSYESSLDKPDEPKHKRKFSLFHHKRKGKSTDEINNKKRFNFIKRNRKTSENENETKEHKNILSKIFSKSEKNVSKADSLKPLPEAPQLSTPNLTITNPNLPKSELDNTKIEPSNNNSNVQACLTLNRNSSPLPEQPQQQSGNGYATPEQSAKPGQSPAKLNNMAIIHRRSSDSDLSITPKGNSLTGSDRSGGGAGCFMRNNVILRSQIHQENFDMLEYPFLTMSKFPPGFIVHIGGAVSARSVKLLERITNVEEPESRDTWWSELRMEIRSHARSLNCNAVLGYSETTSICDDVCVLSATGTAAIIGFVYVDEVEDSIGNLPVIPKPHVLPKNIMTTSLDRNIEKDKPTTKEEKANKTLFESPEHILHQINTPPCSITHLPYESNNVSVRSSGFKCGSCLKAKVPDILLSTIEPPDNLPIIGRGCFVESTLCRQLKDVRGESIAKDISDGLPFLEYELHRLLINKLKIKGMNSIFGLKIKISVGERMLTGIATGTALFLAPLPTPNIPKIVSDRDDKKISDLQKELHETVRKNRDIYQLKGVDEISNGRTSDNEDSEDEPSSLDLSLGNKDCCVLEVDDPQDEEIINLLVERPPPEGFHVVNTETVPGLEDLEIVKNLQMFTQIYRVKIQPQFNLNQHFRRLLESVYFKLRRMVPCALCDLEFRIDLPEPDEIQLCVIGMALGLGKTCRKIKPVTRRVEDDLIFKLDEDQISEINNSVQTNQTFLSTQSLKNKQRSPSKSRTQSVKQRHIPYKERHGVDITPLSYVPGGKIERYLGNLNFFFIRETTSIREEGGLSGFIHSFMTEVLAIVRAHVTALGGNALVAYFMTECVLNYSLYKNQGQCLINVGGDVVFVSYFKEDT